MNTFIFQPASLQSMPCGHFHEGKKLLVPFRFSCFFFGGCCCYRGYWSVHFGVSCGCERAEIGLEDRDEATTKKKKQAVGCVGRQRLVNTHLSFHLNPMITYLCGNRRLHFHRRYLRTGRPCWSWGGRVVPPRNRCWFPSVPLH